MTSRQRSASSLSQHTAPSNTSSPGGSSSGTSGGGGGLYRYETDPLILCAAEIPSFHGDVPSSSYGDGPYPAMTATYIPSGIPPTRPRAHTSTGSVSESAIPTSNLSTSAAFGGLQPRSNGGRNAPGPMGPGMRHASASVLDNSARMGGGGSGPNGGTFYGHHSNSSSVSIPPPPPNPPPSSSALPAHALNQREYQPHYVQRPDYRSHSAAAHYSPAPPAYTPLQHQQRPPPLQGPHGTGQYSQQQQQPNQYGGARTQMDMYRHPAQSSDSIASSFSRMDSSEIDYMTPAQSAHSGNRSNPHSAGTSSGYPRPSHAHSPLATNSSAYAHITPDVAAMWTLDRVLSYLERHHFALEWQQAFKNLNIYGVEFLELSQNQGLLTHVLPEVLRICPTADEQRESVSARHIKKMIRDILRVAHSTDGNEGHPGLRPQQARRTSNKRQSTLPPGPQEGGVYAAEHQFNKGSENNSGQQRPGTRNEYSRAALNTVDTVRHHSPSNSETSFREPARPSNQGSPHSSPNLGTQYPTRHNHSNSTESVASSTLSHRAGEGRNDKKALVMLGLVQRGEKPDSPHERTPVRGDYPEQQQRHGGGKILDKVRQRFWPKDRDNDEDSPTSPSYKSIAPTLPFAISEHNESSSSVDHASASSFDGGRRHRPSHGQNFPAGKGRHVYVFVTQNGRVWLSVEITNVETPDAVRKEICFHLGIPSWENALVHLTEVGQKVHDDVLSDHALWQACRNRADSVASLKFFVRTAPTSGIDTSSRSSLVMDKELPPSPIKHDTFPEPRPLFDGRPLSTAIPVQQTESASSTLKQNSFEKTKERIENFQETGRISPPFSFLSKDDDLDVLRERLAVLRSQQESGNNPKISVTQPFSPSSTSQPPISAGPPTSAVTSPQDPLPEDYSKRTGDWESDYSTLRPARNALSEASPVEETASGKDLPLFDEQRSPEKAFNEPSASKASPEGQSHQLPLRQPGSRPSPQQRSPEPICRRTTRPPVLEMGFTKMPPNRPSRFVDFDDPRPSPYDDRKMEELIPQRKPPPPPVNRSNSASWSKVPPQMKQTWPQEQREQQLRAANGPFHRKNSMDVKPSMVQIRGGKPGQAVQGVQGTSSYSPSSGIGSSLISAGVQFASVTRTPIPGLRKDVPPRSVLPATQHDRAVQQIPNAMSTVNFEGSNGSPRSGGTPSSPGFTWGKNQLFKIPDYESESEQPGSQKLTLQIPVTARKPTPELSPSDLGPAFSVQVEKAVGGTHFPENDVQFASAAGAPSQSDDEDSDADEGLFAIPIASRKGGGKNSAPQSPDQFREKGIQEGESTLRPNLSVTTASAKSVQIKSPSTASTTGSESAGTVHTPPSPEYEEGDDKGGLSSPSVHNASQPTSASAHPHSPADYSNLNRRSSFLRQDVWASRPPAEALINHLDEFFPNLDLDQPILDEANVSPPPSPSPATEKPHSYQLRDPPVISPVVEDPGESPVMNMGSDAPTAPPPIPKDPPAAPRPTSIVAQRNIGHQRISRMKSIREVARGAHEKHKRNTQPSVVGGASGDINIMRRKSTKLFGAKLIEVTPAKGRRGMMQQRQHPPLPQQQTTTQQQQAGVKRQPTFKWFKGELIGKGTYGRVYLGMNATTGEFLAVKQVEISRSGDNAHQKEMISALNQEIDTMQHLDHVNIVQYLGCERKEYGMSIFLEYISGGSVGSCLRKHGRFTEDVVRSLTRQTLSGLKYLHSEGILHRDLKADNILLDVDGTCKISDFGISKKTDNIYGDDPGNSMQGSVFWMAPEVIRPEGQGYSAKIDIWSLGCVVLEMFAGRRPWSKEEAIGAIYKLGSERQAPPIPDDVSSVISPSAIGFLADCHTIDPSDRPTANTLLEEHEFCSPDPNFNFLDTELYHKIRGTFS